MQSNTDKEHEGEKKDKEKAGHGGAVASLLVSEPVKQLADATAQVVGSEILNTQLFERASW